MINQFARTELLLGKAGMDCLYHARVAVFGVGGVGGYTVEALARSGVGTLDLIDPDQVCLTNINRQILATRRTVGQFKVDVARERILEINPDAVVYIYKIFYGPETAMQFDFSQYDYIVDAVDTVTAKLELVQQAQAAGTPIISCMGAGNKMDPAAFEVTDVYKTTMCPLARVMRRELKKRGVRKLKVVCSKEPPLAPIGGTEDGTSALLKQEKTAAQRRQVPGSNAFVPSTAGLIIAGEVVKDLVGTGKNNHSREKMNL